MCLHFICLNITAVQCLNSQGWCVPLWFTPISYFQGWNLHEEEKAVVVSSLKLAFLTQLSITLPTCCVGVMQKMDSWVLVRTTTLSLSRGAVMCSVEGDWKKLLVEDNTHCSCCMMGVCTRVVLTAVDSWATTNQGFTRVGLQSEQHDTTITTERLTLIWVVRHISVIMRIVVSNHSYEFCDSRSVMFVLVSCWWKVVLCITLWQHVNWVVEQPHLLKT